MLIALRIGSPSASNGRFKLYTCCMRPALRVLLAVCQVRDELEDLKRVAEGSESTPEGPRIDEWVADVGASLKALRGHQLGEALVAFPLDRQLLIKVEQQLKDMQVVPGAMTQLAKLFERSPLELEAIQEANSMVQPSDDLRAYVQHVVPPKLLRGRLDFVLARFSASFAVVAKAGGVDDIAQKEAFDWSNALIWTSALHGLHCETESFLLVYKQMVQALQGRLAFDSIEHESATQEEATRVLLALSSFDNFDALSEALSAQGAESGVQTWFKAAIASERGECCQRKSKTRLAPVTSAAKEIVSTIFCNTCILPEDPAELERYCSFELPGGESLPHALNILRILPGQQHLLAGLQFVAMFGVAARSFATLAIWASKHSTRADRKLSPGTRSQVSSLRSELKALEDFVSNPSVPIDA